MNNSTPTKKKNKLTLSGMGLFSNTAHKTQSLSNIQAQAAQMGSSSKDIYVDQNFHGAVKIKEATKEVPLMVSSEGRDYDIIKELIKLRLKVIRLEKKIDKAQVATLVEMYDAGGADRELALTTLESKEESWEH